MRSLVWFRRDLRVADHQALVEASRRADDGVVGLFVISPEEWQSHDDAPIKVNFWLRSLRELSASLGRMNIPLKVAHAKSARSVPAVVLDAARETGCESLHFNHEYEVDESRRDEKTIAAFESASLDAHAWHDHVVFPPDEIRTKQGGFYSVFSPFKRAWIAMAQDRGIESLDAPKKQPKLDIKSDEVPQRVDGFNVPGEVDASLWPAGEAEAARRLERFIERRIDGYKDSRDHPALDTTSRLSPYLNAGVISPRRCIEAAAAINNNRLDSKSGSKQGPAHWISEVIWREFYQHVLVGYPRVSMGRAFKPETDALKWSDDAEAFDRWREGQTGVPIVDAAMRQLRATGWMHNRLRMIAAMFLTKDLFINWRWGERHFMRHLIDGDLGPNNGGWQWSASTGTDAAPYFRIFNPSSQSRKFDEEAVFIKRWLPELEDVDAKDIHDLSAIPELLRGQLDYPEPIVDHKKARQRVLEAFQALKG